MPMERNWEAAENETEGANLQGQAKGKEKRKMEKEAMERGKEEAEEAEAEQEKMEKRVEECWTRRKRKLQQMKMLSEMINQSNQIYRSDKSAGAVANYVSKRYETYDHRVTFLIEY